MSKNMEPFEKPEYNSRVYQNPKSFTNWTGLPGLGDVFRWKFTAPDNSKIPDNDVLDQTLPVNKPKFDLDSNLSATWLGHATVYTRLDGISFITDPVWANRVSPFRWFGPKRYRKPPCSIDEIPTLNFGVISHNHYDHLDADAVKRLSRRFPDMEWFVPVGLGDWMRSSVNNNLVHELTWGEHVTLTFNNTKYQIYCVPAQHWSQRGLFDRNKSLWSGWAILGPTRKFYYSGDTGFCQKEFEKIGTNLGPFDLSAIPIGCYEPRWFMKSQHIYPQEVVEIHKLVRSSKTLGIHFGTYEMGSNEAYLDPPAKLREEVLKANIRASDIFTIEHGQTWSEDPSEPAISESSSTVNE